MSLPHEPPRPASSAKPTDLKDITPEVLQALPQEERKELLEMLVVAKSHHGPLPAPETLEHYGRIIPNAPAILLNEVVKQSAHRQEMERKLVEGSVSFSSRGQWMAFFLVIFLSSLATYLAVAGHAGLAGTVFVTTIGAVVGAFIYGTKARDEPEDSAPAPSSGQQIKTKQRKKH